MPDEKGRYLPGEGGRPKGSQNRATAKLRDTVQKLLEDNAETIMSDLKKLDAKARADVWCKLLEFALPKLSRVEAVEPPTDVDTLMALPEDERIRRIVELRRKMETDGQSKRA